MIETLSQLLEQASYTVVFTGAGMSTESGLPDFRSNKGLWKKFNPDELAHVNAIYEQPKAFTEFYRKRLQDVTSFKPHEGHEILADWEKRMFIKGIITQNVDGFHHDAGSKNVLELHGALRSLYCDGCQEKHSVSAYIEGIFHCHHCGGIIRPGVALFGENLPEKTFQRAEVETLKADLFIVLGSSLTVSPANMFPMLAYENGAQLIIVNREPTPLDRYATMTIQNQTIKEVLTKVEANLSPGIDET